MSFNKNNIINGVVFTLIPALILAALFAHFRIPAVAIAAGFLGSMSIARFALKHKNKKDLINDAIYALLGSLMGWVALLI